MYRTVSTILLLVCLLFVTGNEVSAQQGGVRESEAPVRDSKRSFRRYVVSWRDFRNRNIVMQQRDYSCGSAVLATVLRYYWGDKITETDILRVIEENLSKDELQDRFREGLTITDLRLAAVKKGYNASIGRIELDELYNLKVPVIVAIRVREYDHFVVVRGIVDDWIYLADPSRGNLRMPVEMFADQWIENALLVVVKPGQTQSKVSRLWISQQEVDRGLLNKQLIRTQPPKAFNLP